MRAVARVLAAACLLPVLALAEAGVAQQDEGKREEVRRTLTLTAAVTTYVDASETVAIYNPAAMHGELLLDGPQPATEAEAEGELIAALRNYRLQPVKLGEFLQIALVGEAASLVPYVKRSELATLPPTRHVVTVVPLKHTTMIDVRYLLSRPPLFFVETYPNFSAVLVEGLVGEVRHRVRWIENIDRQLEVISRVIPCRNVEAATVLEPLRQAAINGATVGVVGNQIVLSGLTRDVDALAARLAELDRK